MAERVDVDVCVVGAGYAGLTLPYEGGAYTTAKFAVRGLSESLRLSLAPEGIGVSRVDQHPNPQRTR